MSKSIQPALSDYQTALQHLINEANQWYIASRRCHADVPLSPNVTQSLLSPSVVCNAFSIEIYVKSILVFSGTIPPKHHLIDKLFLGVPISTRSKVSARFSDYWRFQDNILEEYLAETANWFKSFRYVFEQAARFNAIGESSPGYSLNMNKFWAVTRSLHNTLIELKPDLTIIGETSSSFERGSLPY